MCVRETYLSNMLHKCLSNVMAMANVLFADLWQASINESIGELLTELEGR